MRTMNLKSLQTVGVVAAVGFAGILVAGAGKKTNAQSPRLAGDPLEGTWQVAVTQYDCETGAQVGGPFQSLLTFARGGTLTETTANPMFYPSERGPGHGVWREIEGGYSASSVAFITLNGALTTTQTITQKITMRDDPNRFSSQAQVQFFNPAGSLIRSGCAAAVGERFH